MTTLQTINASASPEVQMNENFETLSADAIYGKRQPATSGLTWGYYGGLYNGNTIANGTVTLTDNADNYVVVLRSTGVVSVSTSSTNSTNPLYAKLYKVTTVSGVVTVALDQRQDTNGFKRGEGSSGGGTELKGLTFTSDTSSTADSDPGNGLFKWNNATQNSATVLYFDNQTADGVSLTTFYASLGSTGFMYIQQQDDSTKWQLWKWTAAPVDGTGYRKFTVALQASGGSIGNSKLVDVDFSGLDATGLGTVNVFTKNQSVTPVTNASVTGTYTPDASLSNNFQLTLTGNTTIANPSNLTSGMVLNFCVDEDATGGRTISFGSAYKWPGGTVPTWVTTASAKNFFSAYYDGTILRCSGGAGYA